MSNSVPVLRPETPASREALQADEVRLDTVPFRVGRESRYGLVHGQWRSMERRQLESTPNNELYLIDSGDVLNVSREHLVIEEDGDGGYTLTDLGSTCGTIVDDTALGEDSGQRQATLENGSRIIIGTPESPFIFTFVIEDGER
jgi:hypothetical protein